LTISKHFHTESIAKSLLAKIFDTKGLQVKFFESWHPDLDEALNLLPEEEICPHELFRMLCQVPGLFKKQIILVKKRDDSIAVACFRRNFNYWVPVTHFIVPGFLFPVKENYIGQILSVIGSFIHYKIGWWRWRMPPPHVQWIRSLYSEPTYAASCSGDFEKYWRQNGNFKDVRLFRNRCKNFNLKINLRDSAEWTIKNSEAKWRLSGIGETPGLKERLLASKYLEMRGLYHTLSLVDQQELTAAISFIIHHNDAVAYVNYRNPHYDRYGVMTHLMESSFYWARDMGFDKIDWGGSFDYKNKWAPEDNKKWMLDVCRTDILVREYSFGLLRKAEIKIKKELNKVAIKLRKDSVD